MRPRLSYESPSLTPQNDTRDVVAMLQKHAARVRVTTRERMLHLVRQTVRVPIGWG
jgi:hypothetical protein